MRFSGSVVCAGLCRAAAILYLFLSILPLFGQQPASQTPQQRVEVVTKKAASAHIVKKQKLSAEEIARCLDFTCTVVNEAGVPVPGVEFSVEDAIHYWAQQKTTDKDGTFRGKVWPGAVVVTTYDVADRYEAYSVQLRDGFVNGQCRIVLKKGRDYRVRCVDDAGKPVEGATIRVDPPDGDFDRRCLEVVTDKSGYGTFKHMRAGRTVGINAGSPRHQSLSIDSFTFSDAQVAKPLRLIRRSPHTLVLKEEGSGKPLAGLEVSMRNWEPDSPGFSTPNWGERDILTSNAKGEIVLTGLDSALTYELLVRNDTHGCVLTYKPDPSGKSKSAAIPRKTLLMVSVLNVPEDKVKSLELSMMEKDSSGTGTGHGIEPRWKDGRVEFESMVRRTYPVELRMMDKEFNLGLNWEDTRYIEYDYNELKPKRGSMVTVRLVPPTGKAPPQGTLGIYWNTHEGDKNYQNGHVKGEIKDGCATIEVPKGATFHLDGSTMYGGKLESELPDFPGNTPKYKLEAGQEAMEISVDVRPAGVIRANVQETDGTRGIGCVMMARNVSLGSGAEKIRIKSGTWDEKAKDWYASPPIEFGPDEYYVYAICGYRYVVSERFRVTALRPVRDELLTLPAAVTRTVRLVDMKGNPFPHIHVRARVEFAQFGYGDTTWLKADADGHIPLLMNPDSTHSDVKIEMTVITSTCQPHKTRLRFDEKGEAVVEVEPGKRLFGRIVNKSSVKMDVEKLYVSWSVGERDFNGESVHPKADGSFEILDAPDRPVRMAMNSEPDGVLFYQIEDKVSYTPGDGKEIILEAYDKPKPPPEPEN